MEESSYPQLFELVQEALGLLGTHEEREFGPEMARRLSERTGRDEQPLSTTECHVLDQVWKGTTTAARIAEKLGMTRGGVSKAVSKLNAKGFLETPRSQDSAREVALRLTPRGEAACEVHAEMHADTIAFWSRYFETFSDQEQDVIERFLRGVVSRAGER